MRADHLPRASELTFDTQSAFAALGAIALAAIMVSIVPMRLGSRVQLMDTLRSGGRGAGLRGISLKARRALVVGELAGSLVLVTSAGLLVRSLSHQLNANLGFDAVHGVTFEVSLPPISYPERPFATGMEHAAAVQFLSAALDNIRALPGVTAAGIGKPLPLSGAQQATVFTPEGELPALQPDAISPIAQFSVASADMIRALGTSIITGRDFSSSDGTASPAVVIVNESMARWLWPGKNAIGKRIRIGRPEDKRAMAVDDGHRRGREYETLHADRDAAARNDRSVYAESISDIRHDAIRHSFEPRNVGVAHGGPARDRRRRSDDSRLRMSERSKTSWRRAHRTRDSPLASWPLSASSRSC